MIISGREIKIRLRQTGLVGGDLAVYLGLAPSALSKIISGRRAMQFFEEQNARAFFSVVPERYPDAYYEAVRRLRLPRSRAAVAKALFDWWDDQPSSDPAETAELLEVLCDPKVRTDQIVALSRLAGLDLFAMVCGRPAVRLAGQLGINDPILDELTLTSFETATRAWAVQVRSEQSYRLSGAVAGKEAVLIPGTWSGSRSPGAMADGRGFQRRFARCTSYTIPDQSASSYFHGGQVIFLEPPSTPPQAGDLIAIYPVARESSVEPVLGRLVRRSDQNVTIELQGGGRRRIALSQIGSMLRVAFCAF